MTGDKPGQAQTVGGADLVGRFRASARLYPERPAIFADAPIWTFSALDIATDGVAASLAERGIGPRERVALYCPNGADFIVAYLGCLKAGVVAVPINLLLSPREIAFILRDSGARGLFFHASLAGPTAAALGEVPEVGLRIGIGFDDDVPLLDCHLHQLVQPKPAPASAPTAADDAVILYTSGTTGRPKGAVLTHGNLGANALAVADVLGVKPGVDRVLVVLPMFHAFAGTVGLAMPLLAGAAIVPVPRFDPQAITDAVGLHHATIFLGVPSLYSVLMRLADEQLAAWKSVRLAISGGAAMPLALMEAFEQRFCVPILEGDGPTECGPVTAVNPPAGPRRPGSIGPAIPGVEMRICDDQGKTLADGEYGEVCVRGPGVMRAYWQLPEETAAAFFGDWFRTGDLGWRDADGYVYLVDRIKDLIISNGINVYPRVIEEVLARHPSVGEVAVVGEPHRTHGELPIAYVTPAADAQPNAGALKAWCREHLGTHEIPRRIEVLSSLPKNAAGKILKRELRRTGEVDRGVS
ncbi:long-chain-fatty-acid--CoA ligase [Thiohalocapsa halophila]|uniref:long-chain-fatty-acid--CoA ligase n=1 Tax=Thiohalocapsa halophila TaxID=69359 RepID=UPI002ADE5831|nr:long-chain fatty acid--CoA ligase [Thiohalocapsa halophila]